MKEEVKKYKLTSKFQYSKEDPDGKDRNYALFFLNDVLILKQKIPFDPSYDRGYDRVTSIYDVYLLNGSLHQTRGNKWYCGQSEDPKHKERKVKFPVSKTKLDEFSIPKNFKIILNDTQ